MKWNRTGRLGRSSDRGGQGRSSFTLIELLVVIAVIATLATLVASLAAGAGKKRIRARATVLIAELTTAIDGYKDALGFLPPENPNNFKRPPLYYLLKGTERISGGNAFKPVQGRSLTVNEIKIRFGLGGFLNFVPEGQRPKDFYPNLKESNVGEDNGVRYIVMPYKGPEGDFNPVRYNLDDALSPATNNPGSYDLWIDVVIGRETNSIGNWRD